ncbi:ferritin-like domain-containing protein [Hymenobacter persicinus]|uniref:Ferritin-like domain-containing protein n=1 Tax=Hymenobacter persicinus TaxID=2025506 RepID=A0A4V1ZB90_9BACT|nr:ferritin-like domain-containing protein [Hymenobacter persicinus]RYU84253.1 ferritin-like domain-containing protein [Hymenobacter persicinus]
MDLLKIISDIEKVDPEIYDRLDPRRRVFKHFGVAGKALASAAIPGLVASIFSKAYGQTGSLTPDVANVLNFALKLEYLESFFYNKGLASGTLIPTGPGRDAITLIARDETNHVAVLRQTLGSQAITALKDTDFDYTGAQGGKRAAIFGDVFTNYATFLTLAQAFEDTGVRAYKGGAPALITNKAVLTAALNIHSVEARHASHLRTMRRGGPATIASATAPKSWITDGETVPAAAAAVYGAGSPATPPTGSTLANASKFFPAEDNKTQAGVPLNTTFASFNLPAASFSEAFDEPLDTTTVANIAVNFIVSGVF